MMICSTFENAVYVKIRFDSYVTYIIDCWLNQEEEQGEEEEEQRATAPRWGKVRVLHTPYTPRPIQVVWRLFSFFGAVGEAGLGVANRKHNSTTY